jgi:D-glycero-alpha-D-manno-heptose-7-phosphate kinase
VIICRTPLRVSFFGGGTDYPAWYREHGGGVLATTINKYCYLTCRYLPPFFEHRIRLVYRRIELCKTVEEIRHPAVRAALQFLDEDRGIELHHDGDLPARSGMGSSSAFVVGLLHVLHTLRGEPVIKERLAEESIYLEQEVLRETVGSQDQVLATHGGFNHVRFLAGGEIRVTPMKLPAGRLRELQAHLMLFYTGIPRTASDVARSYAEDLAARSRQLRAMQEFLDEAVALLRSGKDIEAFGDLLHEAWQVKRSLSGKVSSPAVDELYDKARAAGTIGGKLTGAGGGGFLLLFVPPDRQAVVRAALEPLLWVPFQFEPAGSQILFAQPGAVEPPVRPRTNPAALAPKEPSHAA